MNIELEPFSTELETELTSSAVARAPLPDGLVLVESAAASLRAWLDARNLQDWKIFHADLPYAELERFAGDADAPGVWHDLPALSGGVAMQRISEVDDTLTPAPAGVLHFERAQLALARWFWINTNQGGPQSLALVAAPSIREVDRAVVRVRARQHDAQRATWQILRGYQTDESQPQRLPIERETLFLTDALAARIDREVIGFFDDRAAAMYRSLGLAYRRGMLLHGPPGNGKTSTIRYIGGRLPKVAALILRPYSNFDQDDLEAAIATWTKQAPAMLVIEDLNWLLERIEVSGFLNALDGIDTPKSKGLLLIASTNHPDRLDPAINNRPGRFDIVMEMGLPKTKQRRAYLQRQFPAIDIKVLEALVERSEGLSFSHLGEVSRIAGLHAIHADRDERSADDIADAMEIVRATQVNADRGFAGALPAFGLQSRTRRSEDEE